MVSQQQLSLFDTATVVKPTYKVGDLVKIRKRPIGASYVKKGDVVEIVAIHPLNGSIKFWNERSERGEFLHPDEIGSIVSPDDSPTPAEVAVGESIAPDDSPTPAEVAVGESIAPDDSPTPAEVAVGESNCPSDMDYLDPISAYKPKGTARGNENYRYYRLSYKEGNKVRQVHIRGGNTDSPIAQAKVQEVRSLLVAGFSPAEIAATLKLKASNL
jgi:hypothetical protein